MEYAHLSEQELEELRKMEVSMNVVLIAYERGYVSSLDEYIGDLP